MTAAEVMSDNLSLSEQLVFPGMTGDPKIDAYIRASVAPNTLKSYAADIRHLYATGLSVPLTGRQLAAYLVSLAEAGYRVSTIRRRLAAISRSHRMRRFEDPALLPEVAGVMTGIARSNASPPVQATPLLRDDLRKVVKALPANHQYRRSRCLLTVGFFGALRRSELVSLRWDDVNMSERELSIRLRAGKTDQLRKGRLVSMAARQDELCPLEAMSSWRATSAGPQLVFPGRSKDDAPPDQANLSPEMLNRLIKQAVSRVGLSPDRYSGHSLRAGFVTQSVIDRVNSLEIGRITGHRSLAGLRPYYRPRLSASVAIDCESEQNENNFTLAADQDTKCSVAGDGNTKIWG